MATRPKGILKHSSGSQSGRRAVWNEKNLQDNEDIKAQLNPTKIDEPKTPYHAPLDADMEMEPLNLDGDEANAPAEAVDKHTGEQDEAATAHRHADDSSNRSTSRVRVSLDGDEGHDSESPRSSNPEFSKHRKDHYDMKAALARGRALVEDEDS